MIYRIDELSTLAGASETYVLVSFWQTRAAFTAGDTPYLTEEFHMQIRDSSMDIAKDGRGWFLLDDGNDTPVDYQGRLDTLRLQNDRGLISDVEYESQVEALRSLSFKRVRTTWDCSAIIEQNICNYWDRVAVPQKFSGDHTADADKPLFRDGALVRQRPGSARPTRDGSDPLGVTKRADVGAMLNRDVSLLDRVL